MIYLVWYLTENGTFQTILSSVAEDFWLIADYIPSYKFHIYPAVITYERHNVLSYLNLPDLTTPLNLVVRNLDYAYSFLYLMVIFLNFEL